MSEREVVTAWPWVSIQDGKPMLRMKDESGDRAERQRRVEEKYRQMPTAQLKAMDGKPVCREENLAVHLEAWKRGLMDATGEKRLLALLKAEETERVERQEAERWRARFPFLDESEIAAMRAAGGGR